MNLFKKYHFTCSSFQLAVLFTLLNVLVFDLTLFYNIFTLFNGTNSAKLLFTGQLLLIYTLLLLAIFYLLFIKYFTKILIVFILICNSLILYFILQYHVIIDKFMMINTFQTDTHEATDLITFKLFIYLIFLGILPAIAFMSVKIIYKPLGKEILFKFLFLIIAIIISLVLMAPNYKNISSFARNNSDSITNLLPYNYISSSLKAANELFTPPPKFVTLNDDAKLHANWQTINKKNTVFVVILGESARQSNFSLYGYPKNTNYFLQQQNLIIFKNTQSCGTATAMSVPCMFSNFTRDNFSIKKARYTESLLDVLQKASFDVLWINNNAGCKDVCNRVTYKNISTKKSTREGHYDEVLLTQLQQELPKMATNKPKFIVLHMMGSHGPTYYLRYPKKFEKFHPNCPTADLQKCTQQEVENSYNNTIYYDSYVINEVINYLKKQPNLNAAVLYIADHGESLGENGIYLHGFPYLLAPSQQKTVPFFMWMSKGFSNTFIKKKTCLTTITKKEYTHDNFFHSILGLLQVQSNTYNNTLDIFKPCE